MGQSYISTAYSKVKHSNKIYDGAIVTCINIATAYTCISAPYRYVLGAHFLFHLMLVYFSPACFIEMIKNSFVYLTYTYNIIMK